MITPQDYRKIEDDQKRLGALADAELEADLLRTRLVELYATEAALLIRRHFEPVGPVQRIEFNFEEEVDGHTGPSTTITAVYGPGGMTLYDADAEEGKPGYDAGFDAGQAPACDKLTAAMETNPAYFGHGPAGHVEYFLLPA